LDKRTEILINAKEFLYQYNNISFALIFGSYNTEQYGIRSDMDIGVFCDPQFDLMTVGKIVTELEKIADRKVDFVQINDMYNKSPLLAYRIITNSTLLFSRYDDHLINYKKETFLHYFDTIELRKKINTAFHKRISDNMFGRRNYA